MTIEGVIIWLVIGAIAGWLAGQIMEGYGFGLIGNIVVALLARSLPAGSCRGSGLSSSAVLARRLSMPSLGR